MPDIRLPDGAVRHYDASVTVAEIAASIGPGLAKAALAGKVDGKLVDTSHVVERDASVAIVTDRDPEGLEVLRTCETVEIMPRASIRANSGHALRTGALAGHFPPIDETGSAPLFDINNKS